MMMMLFTEVDDTRLQEAKAKLDVIASRWKVEADRVEVASFKSGSVAAQPSSILRNKQRA